VHVAAAARARLVLGIDHDLVARQMRWQRAVIADRATGAGSWLRIAGWLGRILSGLMLGGGLFLILETELQLISQLFGATTKLMAGQALDQ
jgi:hypothetical protein